MNIIKYKRLFLNKKYYNVTIFILNFENNIYSIFLFILKIKYKYSITHIIRYIILKYHIHMICIS